MVNYLYDPDSIEANHEVFVRDGHVVRSPSVEALVAAPPPADPKSSSRGIDEGAPAEDVNMRPCFRREP